MRKKGIMTLTLIAALLAATAYFYAMDARLTVSRYVIKAPKALRIVQLSDLHGREFGRSNAKLLALIESLTPDAIFITGDLIGRDCANFDATIDFTTGLTALAPVYYTAGNHEHDSGRLDEITQKLQEGGVTVLQNSAAELDGLVIAGVDENAPGVSSLLDELRVSEDFVIMLNHYPHTATSFSDYADVIFSGHAHGGYIRLPVVGGLIAPDQGFFPKYCSGEHGIGRAKLVISRGLGSYRFPPRVFNSPDVVLAELFTD